MEYSYFFFDFLAFLSCLWCYRYLDKNFKWFLPYLAFVVIYEFVNIYNWLNLHNSNAWCNNLEGLLELILYGRFIISFENSTNYKRKANWLIAGGLLISLIDIFFIHGFWKLATIASVLQSTILVILICKYYYKLMIYADENLDLLKHSPFLAATGILFYSLANFIFYAAFGFMAYKNNYHFYILAEVIPDTACFILFILLSFSFICFLKTKKLSS